MLGAGKRNKRVSFQRETRIVDGAGGYRVGWDDIPGGEVWAAVRWQSGREQLQAGALASAAGGVLTVLSSAALRGVTAKDRVVVDGAACQIRSVANPDSRNAEIEMVIDQGVAV